MLNEKNKQLGLVRSAIRELFEYGKIRKSQIGEDKVYDFSLGNPSVPAPEEVSRELVNLIENGDTVALHGYTSAQGDASVRHAVAEDLNLRYGAGVSGDYIYMTCGAAASITITLHAILNAGDEVITFAPYFPEYKVFTEGAGGKLTALQPKDMSFQPDVEALKRVLNGNTKAVIINSPNNPSGAVYSAETLKNLCEALKEYKKATGNTVYLISDEPYRELVYDDAAKPPFITRLYADSIICYSYSKSLSLPGERIGYIALGGEMAEKDAVYAAVCGAGRALGYVCAPNLFQQLVKKVTGKTADISVYKSNRDKLYSALVSYGFQAVKPDGAFYLFVRSPESDASAFAERAKDFEILLVPSDSFGCAGFVRISYCVDPSVIERSLPAFKALAQSYGLIK